MTETAKYLVTLSGFKYPETSWVKITTITMISKFSSPFDIEMLKSRLEALGPISLRGTPAGHGVPSATLFLKVRDHATGVSKKVKCGIQDPFVWTLKQTTFYNQVSLGYIDQFSAKSAKIFPNGSVQVAGCSSLSDCTRILDQLRHILATVMQMDSLTCAEPRIVMINTNFSLNSHINLMETTRLFASSKKFSSVTFDPDRYSAVKIKFKPGNDMKQVTVSMFSTGKTIITGAETLKEIVFAYKMIVDHVNDHSTSIKVGPASFPDTFDFIEGWKITEAVEYFKSVGVEPWTWETPSDVVTEEERIVEMLIARRRKEGEYLTEEDLRKIQEEAQREVPILWGT
jgi:TATA-box binding protein (TBP) (component of TFIID and TFIIIB)